MVRILCVEDEDLIRKLIVEELEDEGYETVEAADGEQGLEAILTYKPDLVLCDVNMPVMDGHKLLATLRDDHPELADMPFIFLSALADRKDIIAGRKLGADEYLTKPIDFEMLLVSVQARLDRVDRMDAHKQQQMVKLYKALSSGEETAVDAAGGAEPEQPPSPSPPPPAPKKVTGEDVMTVAIVCNDEIDLSDAETAMIKAGHRVVKYVSGARFQHAIDDLQPSMLLISFDTTDTQAPFLMKVLGGKEKVSFGSVVFVPPNLKHMCGTSQTAVFDAFVEMPTSKDRMLDTIDNVFKARRKAKEATETTEAKEKKKEEEAKKLTIT